MSRQAIAAVLARSDLACGERLVALSLASFAGRENRAFPAAPAASARAGLGKSRYHQAREQLVARDLVAVVERATGRGRASTVRLVFADSGPWWDGDINVGLFEAVLTFSRARGPERLLLATMAAVADEDGAVRDLSTEQLCSAAGIADRTYRRARTALLASDAVELLGGGRGNTNVWVVRDPRELGDGVSGRSPRRVAPPAGARPLMVPAAAHGAEAQTRQPAAVADGKGGHDRTLPVGNGPILTGVSGSKGGQNRTVSLEKCPSVTGVSGVKGGQDRTLFELAPAETPAQTPAETPAPAAAERNRAVARGRERSDLEADGRSGGEPSPGRGRSPVSSPLSRGSLRAVAMRQDATELLRANLAPNVLSAKRSGTGRCWSCSSSPGCGSRRPGS
jgi:hypothetical protein